MLRHLKPTDTNNFKSTILMKTIKLVLAVILCSAVQLINSQQRIVIKNVSVIPMTGDQELINDQTVVIEGNRIVQIGDYVPGNTDKIIDASGQFLMPGLTEMHAHIPVPVDGNDELVRETLFLYLSQGVTTIRGMLGDPYHLELKENVKEGSILGPRIYTSSPSINGNSVKTVDEAIEKVTRYKNEGYDFLKIHPGIKLEVWNAIEETANNVGITFAGHVPVEVGIHRALEARFTTIDHLDGYIDGLLKSPENHDPNGGGFFGYGFIDDIDPDKIKSLVQKTKINGVAVVPTQTLFSRWFSPYDINVMMEDPEMKYLPSQTRFTWRQSKTRLTGGTYNPTQWAKLYQTRKKILQEMVDQDVIILLGSDAPQVMNVPGFSLHREMQDMADGGIDNFTILESGTYGPARFFGAASQYGSVREGLVADLILLEQNPLESITNTRSIVGIFVRGEYLGRDEIDRKLEEIAKKNEG